MNLPTTVVIGAFTFTINVDQSYLDRSAASRGEELAGFSEFSHQKITIGEFSGEDYQADTVLHEILHMILRVGNCLIDSEVANGGVDDIEERVVSVLAGVLLDTLRRNPELVSYLCRYKEMMTSGGSL